jgi:hypothetical protein
MAAKSPWTNYQRLLDYWERGGHLRPISEIAAEHRRATVPQTPAQAQPASGFHDPAQTARGATSPIGGKVKEGW